MNALDSFVYSRKWGVRIARHVTFWTMDGVSILVVLSADNRITIPIMLARFLVIPFTAAITYFIIYHVIPAHHKNKDLLHTILCLVFAFLFVAYGIRYYRLEIIYPLVDPDFVARVDRWNIAKVLRDTFNWMPGICLAIAIKVMKNRSELLLRNKQLVKEKKNAELAFLKAQMHPHFLFNTLNTLYAHAIKAGDASEEVVLRLSNLLRFILEECDKRVIPIEQEIKVIEDYFELKKLRHGTRLNIDSQITLTHQPVYVSPLLMLPIIENSFKHTLMRSPGPVHIKVRISSDDDFINLYVENDLFVNGKSTGSGKGLASVQRQLEMLYESTFEFQTKTEQGKFKTFLRVPIMKTDEQNQLHYH